MAPASVVFFTFILYILPIFVCNARLIPSDLGSHHLEGSHKGETVDGLYQIESYLIDLGYLTYQGTDIIHAKNDYFDDQLESAIKFFQHYHHLNASGILDKDTIKAMAKPRCGMPDITPSNNHYYNISDNYHFNASSHYTFFPDAERWPASKTYLTYAFVPPYKIDVDVMRLAFHNAFQSWSIATNKYFEFEEIQNPEFSDLQIIFADNYAGTPFMNRYLAVAYAPTGGKAFFDESRNWVIGISPHGYDLETVARHEIGHLLGLGHTTIKQAVMYPYNFEAEIKVLQKDDVEGIRALYKL